MSLLHNLTGTRHQPPGISAFVRAAPSHTFAPGPIRTHRVMSRMRFVFETVRRTLGLWLRRRNDRAMLRALSLRDIHDFCPRHAEAEAEMNKPFWRA